ncbi:MAG: hypothetical protein OXG06_01265 [Gammaproteobacteria bacterium]|nr:hypothetical protein [Gammaproteobacteria bacterium]
MARFAIIILLLLSGCGGGGGHHGQASYPETPVMMPEVGDVTGPTTPTNQPDLPPTPSPNLPALSRSVDARPPSHADHFTHESLGPWLEGIFESTYGLDVISSLDGWKFREHEGPAHDLEYYYHRVMSDELENATYSGDVAGLLLPSRVQTTGTVGVSFNRFVSGNSTHLRWTYAFEDVPVEDMTSYGTYFGAQRYHLPARGCDVARGCHSSVSGIFFNDRNTLAGYVASPEFIGIFATKRD